MKRFILMLFMAIVVVTANAQEQELDYVFLKNGTAVKGMIENVEENISVTIRSVNGEVYSYPMIEVNRLAYGKKPVIPTESSKGDYVDYTNYQQGFWCAVELQGAYSCHLKNDNGALTELDIVGGYRFNEFFRLGLGLGARYYIENDKIRHSDIKWSFPIFLNLRGNIIPSEHRTVVPFYSVDLGGTVRDGFMVRPTIGVRLGDPRSAFTVGITYLGQSLKAPVAEGKYKRDYTSFVGLKIGYEF